MSVTLPPNAPAVAAWVSSIAETARTLRRRLRPEPALIGLAH